MSPKWKKVYNLISVGLLSMHELEPAYAYVMVWWTGKNYHWVHIQF